MPQDLSLLHKKRLMLKNLAAFVDEINDEELMQRLETALSEIEATIQSATQSIPSH